MNRKFIDLALVRPYLFLVPFNLLLVNFKCVAHVEIISRMVEVEKLIEALNAYRAYLVQHSQPLKAAAVDHCIKIVRRLLIQN